MDPRAERCQCTRRSPYGPVEQSVESCAKSYRAAVKYRKAIRRRDLMVAGFGYQFLEPCLECEQGRKYEKRLPVAENQRRK